MAASFALFAAIGFSYLNAVTKESEAISQLALESSAGSQVQALQELLLASQAPLFALSDIVAFNKGAFPQFEEYSAYLLRSHPDVDGLFLAPGGVVREAVPLQGNEAAIGHDLLKDPDRRAEVEEAIRTGQTVLAGPVNMRQGGVGLFARKPVFWVEQGERMVWGLAVALIKWDGIREAVESNAAKAGFAFTLKRKLETDATPVLLSRSVEDVRDDRSVTKSLPVPGGNWLLAVSPKEQGAAQRLLGQLIVLAAASGSGFLVFLLLRGRHALMDRTVQLEQANEELSRRVVERGVLIKEVHHRVKNNLQVIVSLLDLQGDGADNKEFRELVEACKARVKAISLAHEQLYKGKDLGSIVIKDYLEGVVTNTLRGHVGIAQHLNCRVKADHSTIPLVKAVPLGLIVTELVTNALKHAFAEVKAPSILLDFSMGADKCATLTVKDNGPGFPDGAFPETPMTLGLVLVQNLASQLGGKIDFRNNGGAVVVASFPLEERRPAGWVPVPP